MPRLPLVVASAVLVATALACGGDDNGAAPSPSPTTASPMPLTKEAYVSAVNAICTRVTSEVEGIAEPKTAKDYETTLVAVIDVIDRAQAGIKALTPPAADAAALQANFIGPNDEQAAKFKAALPSVRSAAAAGDTEAAEKAFGESLAEDNPTQDEWMTSYGLTACVE